MELISSVGLVLDVVLSELTLYVDGSTPASLRPSRQGPGGRRIQAAVGGGRSGLAAEHRAGGVEVGEASRV
jgi:hypothetical protein